MILIQFYHYSESKGNKTNFQNLQQESIFNTSNFFTDGWQNKCGKDKPEQAY